MRIAFRHNLGHSPLQGGVTWEGARTNAQTGLCLRERVVFGLRLVVACHAARVASHPGATGASRAPPRCQGTELWAPHKQSTDTGPSRPPASQPRSGGTS